MQIIRQETVLTQHQELMDNVSIYQRSASYLAELMFSKNIFVDLK